MAWRFKASKYKNAAPIVPKPEMCIRDICVGSYQTYGNNIAASSAFMAFNWEHAGSSLAVLPLDDCGRKSKTMPLLHGHTDTVTDLHFSPFHDGLLATGSQDCLVKIWFIPQKGLETSITNPECTFSHKQRRVETVGFHPTADCLLHSTSAGNISLWDIQAQKESVSMNEHPEVIQSLSWKLDGTVLSTSCKDKMVRIIDPRAATPISMTANSHQSIKDSRVVWLGDQQRILTTGFDAARLRQIIIRDLRNFDVPEKTLELDCSTGILMPLFDPDTNMLFLAGKGDTTISYMEVTDKDPHLIEGLRHNGEQTKGACLVPKRALRVMEGEVNRIMQLTSNSVVPIMYQVPRKTYRDFHADLYPETNGFKTDLVAAHWLNGTNSPVPKISLDPAKRELGEQPIIIHRGNLNELIKNQMNKCASLTKIQPSSTTPSSICQNQHQQNQLSQQKQQKFKIPIQNDNNQFNRINSPDLKLTKADLIKKFDINYAGNGGGGGGGVVGVGGNGGDGDGGVGVEGIGDGSIDVDEEEITKKEKNTEKNDQNDENNDGNEIDNKLIDAGLIKNGNGNGNGNCGGIGMGVVSSNGATPPKPLPRTSRNNSMSEPGISPPTTTKLQDESRPIARPRTSYKPRLGPKPFTSSNSDVTFDKVFSVPQVPGSGSSSAGGSLSGGDSLDSESSKLDEEETLAANQFDEEQNHQQLQPNPNVDDTEKEKDNDVDGDDGVDENVCLRRPHERCSNGGGGGGGGDGDGAINDEIGNEEITETHSLEDDLQKAISTAERRKIFETRSESENSMNGEDKCDSELRRMSLNRSSIAERRRIYEKSISVQDEKPQSPLPLTRKDSLVNRSNSPKSSDDKQQQNHAKNSPTHENGSNNESSSQIKKPIVSKTKPSSQPVAEVSTATKRTSTVFGKVSKFRHLKGTTGHKSTHIENIRNISRQIPGECNGFHANSQRVAVPIAGPGGKIAVYELDKPGRLPDGVIPSLVNGCNIMDFQWDPFDATMLAVACDDGIVKLWQIPNGGLTEPTNEPAAELPAHSDKIYFIRFHPLAKNVLLTASYDMSIKLWNLATMEEKMCLNGHTDQIFDFAFSPCGVYGATVCKDGKIRVYNLRKSENPIREGVGPVGTRGARITWAIDGHYIICTGFDKVSERQISIYKSNDLSAPLNTVGLDVSPAILQPFYDEDSSTLFLTGKGDSTIYAFEITDETPFICPLSHHRCTSLHQGLSFLTKNHCDVSSVEFAKALRLTNNTVEPLSFTVPRIKSELFQDDLFPPTRVTWIPTMTSDEWYTLKDKKVKKISLQPEGMDSLSSIQPQVMPQQTPNKPMVDNSNIHSFHRMGLTNAKSKQDEISKVLADRLEINTKLEQDDMEGVDDEEWNE